MYIDFYTHVDQHKREEHIIQTKSAGIHDGHHKYFNAVFTIELCCRYRHFINNNYYILKS